MKTVLIAGVTGFIGRYVARYFFDAGWLVIGLGTRPVENSPNQNLSTYYQLTLPSKELAEIIQQIQPQVCIQCIGRASVGLSVIDPYPDFKASVDATFYVLESLRLYAPKCKVIYLSSAAVYGNPDHLPITESSSTNPISPYGFHKLIAENLCKEFYRVYQLPTASVRIFSAYGPGLRRQVIWDICRKAITYDGCISLQGSGQESRDFIHALDIAKALLIIAESAPMEGESYNLASGRQVEINDLARLVLEMLGYSHEPQFDGQQPVGNPLNWEADISKLGNLNFTPSISLEQGLRTFVPWCRAELVGV